MKSILLVDDEPVIATGLKRTLGKFGFAVEVVSTPEAAHESLHERSFDLILVDFDLNKSAAAGKANVYGIGLVKELRAARIHVPILIYTVLEGALYEQASLDAGADDFVLKRTAQSSMSTFLSRLHMHIRRHERDTGHLPRTTRRLGIGKFTLDRDARVLAADDTPIPLTSRETQLLSLLGANPDRIVPTHEILEKVWKDEKEKSPAALFSAIKRFRQKLSEHRVQNLIENVKGKGFRVAENALLHRHD